MKKRINFLVYLFSFMMPIVIVSTTGMPDYQSIIVLFALIIFVGLILPYHFFRIQRFRKAGIDEPNLLWIKKHPGTAIAYTLFFLLAFGHILYRSHYYSHPEAKALYEQYKQKKANSFKK